MSVTAFDIMDYYSDISPDSLELWHKNKKLEDDQCVGKLKGLVLMNAKVPPHHQLCSPGKTLAVPLFLTPHEAYEVGMQSPPMWNGKL